MKRLNLPLWLGLIVSVLALLSYFIVFVRFPITRDIPWATFLLFAVAVALLITGWRRAERKILATIVTVFGAAILALFVAYVAALTKTPPISAAIPAVGQKAPDFTLPDMNGQPVALSQLLDSSNGVLLIFYRGYW
jgi:hypothetical protein